MKYDYRYLQKDDGNLNAKLKALKGDPALLGDLEIPFIEDHVYALTYPGLHP